MAANILTEVSSVISVFHFDFLLLLGPTWLLAWILWIWNENFIVFNLTASFIAITFVKLVTIFTLLSNKHIIVIIQMLFYLFLNYLRGEIYLGYVLFDSKMEKKWQIYHFQFYSFFFWFFIHPTNQLASDVFHSINQILQSLISIFPVYFYSPTSNLRSQARSISKSTNETNIKSVLISRQPSRQICSHDTGTEIFMKNCSLVSEVSSDKETRVY